MTWEEASALHRFIVLRWSVEERLKDVVQAETLQLAHEQGYFTDPGGWARYDVVGDLGGRRFVSETASDLKRKQRARHIVSYMDSLIHLINPRREARSP
jgi:hypothetical protein